MTTKARIVDEDGKPVHEPQTNTLPTVPGQVDEAAPPVLLRLAVENNLDIEKLERLVALRERWEANRARKAFFEAFARFQASVPTLKKDKHVSIPGGARYRHASLGSIMKQIGPHLEACGLSFRFTIADSDQALAVTCHVTHTEGHSEPTAITAPPDTSGKKNIIQSRGSTVTYLQRYSLIAALGLVTADEDDDGRGRQAEAHDESADANTGAFDSKGDAGLTPEQKASLERLQALVREGRRAEGAVTSIQGKTRWKRCTVPGAKGTDKSFETEAEYPGVRFRTNSNPQSKEAAKRWAVGGLVEHQPGVKGDGDELDWRLYKGWVYVRTWHVRPKGQTGGEPASAPSTTKEISSDDLGETDPEAQAGSPPITDPDEALASEANRILSRALNGAGSVSGAVSLLQRNANVEIARLNERGDAERVTGYAVAAGITGQVKRCRDEKKLALLLALLQGPDEETDDECNQERPDA